MSLHSPVVAVVLAGLTLTASAGSAQNPPEPQQGQAGKDVIWMPTPEPLVERMLTMAQVTPRDVVYDLGSGDGRLVIAAARRGAQAYGVEYNPDLVAFSDNRARAQGVAQKAHFVQGDIFETDFSKATVVTLYLLSTLNMRLRPHLLKMRPGTRVVSHAFTMEDWTPDETSRTSDRTAYLWIVPAPVQGPWRIELAGRRDVRRGVRAEVPEARRHDHARSGRGGAARAGAPRRRDQLRLRGPGRRLSTSSTARSPATRSPERSRPRPRRAPSPPRGAESAPLRVSAASASRELGEVRARQVVRLAEADDQPAGFEPEAVEREIRELQGRGRRRESASGRRAPRP